MTHIVIAGMSTCQKYAQAEFIAGVLSTKLPHFKVRRIVIEENDWDGWLWDQCQQNEWNHSKCPIVWRELAMSGGKAVLIGGLKEFLEYCHEFYGFTAFLTPEEKQMLVEENEKLEKKEMQQKAKCQYKIRKILISGAASHVLPILLSELLNLKCIGKEDGTVIYLYDKSRKRHIIEQIQKDSTLMGADSGVDASKIANTLQEGLTDCDIFIILNEFMRPIETKFDEKYKENYVAMLKLAKVMDEHAPSRCRVVLAGPDNAPVCFNATVLANVSRNLHPQNIVVVTAHIGVETLPVVSNLTRTKMCDLASPAVWGFIGLNQYIDYNNMIYKATYFVPNKRGLKRIPNSTLPQGKLFTELRRFNYLMENIQHLWKYIEQYKTWIKVLTAESSELPKVKAIITLLELWYSESDKYDGEVLSLGITSNGTFGIPAGIFFSQPAVLKDSVWKPYGDYPRPDKNKCNLDDFINTAMYVLLEYAKSSMEKYRSSWKYVDSEALKAEEKYRKESRYRYPEYPDSLKEIKESRSRNEAGVARLMDRIELGWKLDEVIENERPVHDLEERLKLQRISSASLRMSFHSEESLMEIELQTQKKITAKKVREILFDILYDVFKSEEEKENNGIEQENK